MMDFSLPHFQQKVTRYLAESERIHRALNNQSGLALASLHQGIRASFEGDFSLAISRFEEAERLAIDLGDLRTLSRLAGGRALVDLHEGDLAAARRRLEISIQQYDRMGDLQLGSNITWLAVALHRQGLEVWAARVLGLEETLPDYMRSMNAMLVAYTKRFRLGDVRAELRARLGEKAFNREIEVGHQLRLDDLKAIPHPTPNQQAPASASGETLTGREIEVLQLLAMNLSNLQIAEKLVISRRTVDAHLRSIYNKLDVRSREDAVIVAVENQLI